MLHKMEENERNKLRRDICCNTKLRLMFLSKCIAVVIRDCIRQKLEKDDITL
jgi:hypothetical protein